MRRGLYVVVIRLPATSGLHIVKADPGRPVEGLSPHLLLFLLLRPEEPEAQLIRHAPEEELGMYFDLEDIV